MNPHTNYLAVGLFVLVGISTVVVLILWFGGNGESTPTTRYIVPIYSEVNGLSKGSAVRFLGVDVGAVSDISLHTSVAPFVEVLIDVRNDLPIGETTYATLVIQGVTGIANIDLGNDSGQTNRPEANIDGVPLIPFRATGLSAALADSGNITQGLQQFMTRLNAWTSDGNLDRATRILEDLEALTSVLSEQRKDIPDIVATLQRSVTGMEQLVGGLTAVAENDLPVIASDLKETSHRLAGISSRVDAWLTGNDDNINQLLGDGFGSMTMLVDDLRLVAQELSRLTTKLREDPARLIHRSRHDPVVAEP